jgi:uncharacterized protein (TIGR02246 family)
MKTQSTLKAVAILVLPLLLVTATSADRDSDRGLAEIRAAIDEANLEFREGFRNADVDQLAELFTRDARLMPPLLPSVVGREAIRDYMQYWVEYGIRDIKIVTEEVYGSGDTAFEISRSTPVLSTGEELPRSRDMVVWKHEEGRWRVHRIMSTR